MRRGASEHVYANTPLSSVCVLRDKTLILCLTIISAHKNVTLFYGDKIIFFTNSRLVVHDFYLFIPFPSYYSQLLSLLFGRSKCILDGIVEVECGQCLSLGVIYDCQRCELFTALLYLIIMSSLP